MESRQNAMRRIVRTVPRFRFLSPRSVAKYQPKRISRLRPKRKVQMGVSIRLSFRRLGSGGGGFRLGALDDDYARLVHFHLDVIRHLQDDGRLLDIRDEPVDAAASDDLVAGLQARDERRVLLLFLLLGADHEQVKDDADANERYPRHGRPGGLRAGGRGLREKEKAFVIHRLKKWSCHLMREIPISQRISWRRSSSLTCPPKTPMQGSWTTSSARFGPSSWSWRSMPCSWSATFTSSSTSSGNG